jgi:eukaryotic-like serine/threonine-protein kinase
MGAADSKSGPAELSSRRSEGSSDYEDSFLQRVAGCDAEEERDPPPPPILSVLDGKYRLERLLGRGGMGFVFAARNLTTSRRVAIKWMQRRGNLSQLRRRFVREASAAGRIRHRNVIDIYDVASSEEATYLVMELLEGESLRARLNRVRLEPEQAVELALAILEGLNAAHEQGVIHRDLKPENVFLCSAGYDAIKVLDFGISVFKEARPAQETNLTRTGYFVGTPVYTALERLREKQPFDHRVDLYSLGVILYEALTGALPFSGRTPSELTYQLALRTPTPPREWRPDLSPALEAVVLRALAREPDERFRDAAEFKDALIKALKAPQLPSQSQRLGGYPLRIAAILALTLLLGAIGVFVQRARSAPAAAAQTRHELPPAKSPDDELRPLLSPAVATNISATATATPLVASAPARREQPTRKRRGPAPAPPAARSAAAHGSPKPARLTVVVFPYGEVWIDGRHVGPSPATLNLSPGRHMVNAGRTPNEREAVVQLAESETRQIVLSWEGSVNQARSEAR